eukprot:9430504-Lingulodinium_polyedra.AAC.1
MRHPASSTRRRTAASRRGVTECSWTQTRSARRSSAKSKLVSREDTLIVSRTKSSARPPGPGWAASPHLTPG